MLQHGKVGLLEFLFCNTPGPRKERLSKPVMKEMSLICIYTIKNCPRCEELKTTLTGLGIAFETKDLKTKESIVELRVLACFPQEAPVLRFGKTCYEGKALFNPDGKVNPHVIHAISGKVMG